MPLSISIWFLTGRAHLHPWQTHHSEGRVEWPPSQWRLLRAFVAVAGRGLTTLPYPDEGPPPKPEPIVNVADMSKPKERGVPQEAKKKLSFSKAKQTLRLNEPLTDAEAAAWKAANPGDSFATAVEQLRALIALADPVVPADGDGDVIQLSRLATLLHALSATPSIRLPKSAGGHTRQYFPIHDAGIVKNSGSAVFDTFATVRKDQPLVFHWANVDLDAQSLHDLKLILRRLTYFGRAESWCHAEASTKLLACLSAIPQTHWECVCIEDHGNPLGMKEYRDYTLERRLAPIAGLSTEITELLPRTMVDGKKRKDPQKLEAILRAEPARISLLRCLLRESGQDIKDGLERPIGTRWVHYAVPRAVYDVPRPSPQPKPRNPEAVDLVVYALNTATVHRPVLPALTDTLLVADRFRSAAMALCRIPSRSLSGHEADDEPCKDHNHAFWWPRDEDNDGLIDHVFVHARGGFQPNEVDALRRLSRLRQRGGRPDLLVTPIFVGRAAEYNPWQGCRTTTFVSATPYHCPLHLSHGKTGSSRLRPISPVIHEGLRRQGITEEIEEVSEIVFDYASDELMATLEAVAAGTLQEPTHPRQYFAIAESPSNYPPLPRLHEFAHDRFRGACLKDPDMGYPFGLSVGLRVDCGSRFIRALSFCRQRRRFQVKGPGRMFLIRFRDPRPPRPFAIGDQCHFGLGLFIPVPECPQSSDNAEG